METIKYKKFKAHTEKSNAAYAKMTKPQKRVRIARDVLQALRERRLKPKQQIYVQPAGNYAWIRSLNIDATASFQDLLPTLPTCDVCAKGAIMVCAVARQNQVSAGQVETGTNMFDGEKMATLLGDVFSAQQLDKIESEFEGLRGFERLSQGAQTHKPIMKFYERGVPAATRMRIIMLNIIENDGTFRPTRYKVPNA